MREHSSIPYMICTTPRMHMERPGQRCKLSPMLLGHYSITAWLRSSAGGQTLQVTNPRIGLTDAAIPVASRSVLPSDAV